MICFLIQMSPLINIKFLIKLLEIIKNIKHYIFKNKIYNHRFKTINKIKNFQKIQFFKKTINIFFKEIIFLQVKVIKLNYNLINLQVMIKHQDLQIY